MGHKNQMLDGMCQLAVAETKPICDCEKEEVIGNICAFVTVNKLVFFGNNGEIEKSLWGLEKMEFFVIFLRFTRKLSFSRFCEFLSLQKKFWVIYNFFLTFCQFLDLTQNFSTWGQDFEHK
jgi:hypothetical protein